MRENAHGEGQRAAMIFDTHAHYDDRAFDPDREELLARLHAEGVGGIANASSDRASILASHALAEKYDFIFEVLGFHPDGIGEMEREKDTITGWLTERLRSPKAVAVGEIGLDYHWGRENRDQQIRWFRAQMELAGNLGLPVVIHSRDAAQDTMEIVREAALPAGTVDIHCYSYSPEQADQYLAMGCYLGIGGVATFKNARKLKEVVARMPADRILLETDCPYLSPEPFRGKRNDSGRIRYVIQAIAGIRQQDPARIEEICWNNALRFYHLTQEEGKLYADSRSR